MWPEGQVWKPGPAYPATAAALPPAWWFRIRIFCSRGSLTPVGAPNVFLAWGWMRRSGFGAIVLRDVARRPSVETGADVPGYSAALPPAWLFRVWVYCSRGSLTPVEAPNDFLACGRMRRSGFGAIVLRDVARRPSVETGADVPGYSGVFAACVVVSYSDFL